MQTQPVFTTVSEKEFNRYKKAVADGKFPSNNYFGAIVFGNARIELCIDGEDTNYICCNVYLANHGNGNYGRIEDVHKTDVGHEIRRSTEDDGSEYFDLNNGATEYACCDGEEVEVKSVEGTTITFINKNQENPQEFQLTIRECMTAIFGLK